MPNIIIYTDFDGTITAKPGNELVFTPFYQSLLEGYEEGKIQKNYKTTPLKSSSEIQDLFVKKFGEYDGESNYLREDAEYLMTPEAVSFFHKVLSNPDIKVNIVTRNRSGYIKELFAYHKFTAEEISRLEIHDKTGKYDAVSSDSHPEGISHFYVFDDSSEDYGAMYYALTNRGYQQEQIYGRNEAPGQFKWGEYLNHILIKLGLSSEKKESLESINPSSEDSSILSASSTLTALETRDRESSSRKKEPSSQHATVLFDKIEQEIARIKGYKNSKALYKASKIETALAEASKYLQANPSCTIKEFLNYRKDNNPETLSISNALAIKRNSWDFLHTPDAFKNVMKLFTGRMDEQVGHKEDEIRPLPISPIK
ncbi:hypothetical protein [Legionella cardiaca]|uniref:Dot/Icm T4SS effector n=1 Tax=Legionella cardiaca TaxID=1071983 RepID=A0ABY8AXN1_9GAMM|nr:hypothetical protein [Legionella cardiaca]WED43867.1 hypothetical protein PXX05_03540 [Legionella cardiaca]